MTREYFEYLFEQFKADRLSQEGWEELREAIREGHYDDYLKQAFLSLAGKGGVHDSWTPELQDAIWQQIRRERPMDAVSEENLPKPVGHSAGSGFFPRRIKRYAAVAASVGILLALAWIFRPRRSSGAVSTIAKTETAIHPGGNKAMLTLPNGSKIVLDNEPDGQIARQGSASFHKSAGTLSVADWRGAEKNGGSATDASATDDGEALITTPRGGQFELHLPDGSKVWLNSASSLRFPTKFKGRQREVTLTGEGYFEIAKNAKMPFFVNVNHMKIAVLGTDFDAMAYADEKTINTTLLEGAVVVSEGDLSRRLQPGQQTLLNSAGHQMTVAVADLQKTIAWKNGLFEFDNTDLPTIMRQLARWYDIEIIYRSTPDSAALGGSISRNLNLTEVLNLLEANGINHFKIEGKKVFVL